MKIYKTFLDQTPAGGEYIWVENIMHFFINPLDTY